MSAGGENSKETIESRDLVVGLDFGTSCTKVVIRDSATRQAYGVPLRIGMPNIDAWLLPTGLEGTDELAVGNSNEAIVELKVKLMDAVADGVPEAQLLEEQARCAAYLGLVLRKAVDLFHKQWRDLYAKT